MKLTIGVVIVWFFMVLFVSCLFEPEKLEVGQFFTYPPGSQAHIKGSYEYIGNISVFETTHIKSEEKEIDVWIKDAKGNKLLDDNFTLHGAYLEFYPKWDTLEHVFIGICNKSSGDTLEKLNYQYVDSLGRFLKK